MYRLCIVTRQSIITSILTHLHSLHITIEPKEKKGFLVSILTWIAPSELSKQIQGSFRQRAFVEPLRGP
jgi:hypothetical protein